ncbi:VOC family protein [Algoriphagus sediminis]|uniref:VOC family protein n=1 Tax=Algoriphagus sediminis TaxID=3057113 RepID=A0ABT7YFG6_9BACT|nr:VOC family protein [Algoriphagus sediminis]MDN3205269.1 VOC family protein [Algoriphagus sediminis]
MNRKINSRILLLMSLILTFCTPKVDQRKLGAFEAFAEMVQAGNKPLALSHPMSPEEAERFWPEAEKIAEKYGVQVYREYELMRSGLFDLGGLDGMEVFILYSGQNLDAYLKYKDRMASISPEENPNEFIEISRSFGRLLGYPSWRVNNLLAQNTSFRDLEDFGIQGHELIWFYQDLAAAKVFYQETLGLKLMQEDEESAKFQIAGDSYLHLKDLNSSDYSGDENKSVALALLTDHLEDWYAHVQEKGVEIKYTLKQNPEGAHDGFVAVDPEGYLLEFEMFRDHPENEKLMPRLRYQTPLETSFGGNLNFYSSVSWLYYQDMLPMQNWVEEELGLELIVDQGWAKIYALSDQSYLGLVDGLRGMNEYSDSKLVEFGLILEDPQGWESYLQSKISEDREVMTFQDLGGYLYRF